MTVVHVDLKFTHDLSLLEKLFQFNMDVNDHNTKVVTTTNTISDEIKQVQIHIEHHRDETEYDTFNEVMDRLKTFDNYANIETMNIFVQENKYVDNYEHKQIQR